MEPASLSDELRAALDVDPTPGGVTYVIATQVRTGRPAHRGEHSLGAHGQPAPPGGGAPLALLCSGQEAGLQVVTEMLLFCSQSVWYSGLVLCTHSHSGCLRTPPTM